MLSAVNVLDSELDPSSRKKARGKVAIVDTQVRRSPRIKGHKGGFKDPQCRDKNCLGCNAAPPVLSTKTIRKLGSSLCDMDPESLTDAVLSKKKKTAPVGTKSAVEPSLAEDIDDDEANKP